MMYLLQFENGTITKSESLSDDILQQVKDGYITVIDISDPDLPTIYFDNDWQPVMKYLEEIE